MKLSDFGKDFLLLALRLDKHSKGYVDFYFGPNKLRKIAENEDKVSPKQLLNDCKILQKSLFTQGYDKHRERYLEKCLTALRTSVEILNGIKFSIEDQFFNFYDVPLQIVDETKLDELIEVVKEAYGVSENLDKCMNELRKQRTIPGPKVLRLFKKALKIVEMRTKEMLVDLLPPEEKISLNLVNNSVTEKVKWAYYNWYNGNFRSQIDINPNYNMYWTSFLSSAAHEGYPGHHTEFSVKEQVLFKDLNQFEHSILLLKSPKLIISEGIAEMAANLLFSYRDQAEIGLREFCPDTSKEESLDLLILQKEIKGKIHLFSYNLAYHALVDKWSEKRLVQYANSYGIFSHQNIKNQLNMIYDLVHSTTIFSYNLGSNLIINKYGEFPSIKNFKNLLSNSILPSDLV